LATVSGLGTLTIAWLLTTTINFTLTLTPEAAANYAGLAPQLRQSGSSVRGRPRVGHGGNARLRRAVYMASLSAREHNPVIKAFYSPQAAADRLGSGDQGAGFRPSLCLAIAFDGGC